MRPAGGPAAWRTLCRGLLAAALLAAGWQHASAQVPEQEFAARNQVNFRRAQVGLAPLALNAPLTVAARGHLNWLVFNNQFGHVQNPALPTGFTGEFLQDRIAAAGYGNLQSGSEVISFGPATGVEGVESLLQAIYHRFGIFGTSVDEQGIAFAGGHPANGNVLVADFAARAATSPPPPGWAGTYPFDGQSNVPVDFYSNEESPDPVAGANRIGYPVSLQVKDFSNLAVQSFTLSHSGQSVPAVLLTGSPDAPAPDAHTPTSAAALLPIAPLAYGATYTASFSGTSDGVPISRTWSFTTVSATVTVAPSPVHVAPGAQVLLSIAGGSGRYGANWSYAGPTSPISIVFAGSQTAIVSGLTAGEATLRISDVDGHDALVTVIVAAGADSSPDPIVFPPRNGVPPGAVIVSPLVRVTGFDLPVAVTVSAGEYSINGAAYGTAPGTLQPGDRLSLRVTAPNGHDAVASALVSVGGVAASFQVTTHSAGSQALFPPLGTGWNLMGNGLSGTLDPVAEFGHADLPLPGVSAQIESVWAWNPATQKWQFHSPLLTPAQSAAYAASQGFEPLTAIPPGRGYWALAYAPVALLPQSGTPVVHGVSTFSALPQGWNLIAIGAPLTPPAFNVLVGDPPLPGQLPTSFESLWMWDVAQTKWFFYSPFLEALPGGLANVAAYAASHGLLDFTASGRQLGPAEGFWVYRP